MSAGSDPTDERSPRHWPPLGRPDECHVCVDTGFSPAHHAGALLRYVVEQYERVVEIHAQVVMDTPEDQELHDRAVTRMRAAVEPVHSMLAAAPTQPDRKPVQP